MKGCLSRIYEKAVPSDYMLGQDAKYMQWQWEVLGAITLKANKQNAIRYYVQQAVNKYMPLFKGCQTRRRLICMETGVSPDSMIPYGIGTECVLQKSNLEEYFIQEAYALVSEMPDKTMIVPSDCGAVLFITYHPENDSKMPQLVEQINIEMDCGAWYNAIEVTFILMGQPLQAIFGKQQNQCQKIEIDQGTAIISQKLPHKMEAYCRMANA